MMRDHTGKVVSHEELINARLHVASLHREYARDIRSGKEPYAAHVTEEQKEQFAREEEELAYGVVSGAHDHEFWCWQLMNTFITGRCVSFLPYSNQDVTHD